MKTLFKNVSALRLPGKARADWVLVEGDSIAAHGDVGDEPTADRVVDGGGASLIPAFCDAHVHLPATGLYEVGLNFRDETKADAIVDAFARRAEEGGGILFGGNFEDPLDRPLTRHELDRAVGPRSALLARADMHSCIVSTALLEHLDIEGLEGVDRDDEGRPTGYLREKAASEAWSYLDRNLTPQQQKEAVLAAVRRAYSKGICSVHEMFVVEWRGWDSWEVFVDSVADVALEIVPYLGTDEVDRVVELGYHRIGGDFFLDGSFGSHTAWMHEPYATAPPEGSPPNGIAYRADDELFDYFTRAQAKGLQVGVHAIGDAAIEQAIGTWEKVAADSGIDEVRVLGHRIEHFECASDDHIARAVALGLKASVQPAFDRFWGGEDGLYARRIGWERAALMNRFDAMLEAGMWVGAGSDSTVTPLDPFLQIASLRAHHVEEQSVGSTQALRLHTMGARRLGPAHELSGTLEPGAPAELALLDRDPVESSVEELLDTQVLGTWIAGRRVWPSDEAESA